MAAHIGSAAAGSTSSSVVLKANLTGPYLHTTATGTGTATITFSATRACWKFSYSGIDTPNISGIHVAPPPPAGYHKHSVFPFTATTSTAPGCESLGRWGGPVGRMGGEDRREPEPLLRDHRNQPLPKRRHRRGTTRRLTELSTH